MSLERRSRWLAGLGAEFRELHATRGGAVDYLVSKYYGCA
jgi:hypothetical protein